MPRRRKTIGDAAIARVEGGSLTYPSSEAIKRITLMIHSNVDLNVEVIAAYENRLKMDIIEEALKWYLHEKKGIPEPTRAPKITWEPTQAVAAAPVSSIRIPA